MHVSIHSSQSWHEENWMTDQADSPRELQHTQLPGKQQISLDNFSS